MRVQTITSTANAHIKALKQLAQSNTAYKDSGQVWLEGVHLCDAYLLSLTEAINRRGHLNDTLRLQTMVLAESTSQDWIRRLEELRKMGMPYESEHILVLPDGLFASVSGLPSNGGLGFVLNLPSRAALMSTTAHTLILDGVQDTGNVGSILRSAAAFGVQQVLALQGTAALWSPKVVRAAMGAHFSLQLVENLQSMDIDLSIPLLATHVHKGDYLDQLQVTNSIPHPCAWIMGHEGQGVSAAMLDKASQFVRIRQKGQESLNVAVAAAVCLYAGMAASGW
jgi:RNA methyltransferase, TrmH family